MSPRWGYIFVDKLKFHKKETHLMNSSKIKRQIIPLLILFSIILLPAGSALAEETKTDNIATRYGLGATLGNSYDPTGNIDFYMLTGSVLYDYEKIWHHRAPEPLRFKVEYSLGMAREKKAYLMTSLNIFALYYLDLFKGDKIAPYVEGGIGVIYTGFQEKGQGLKVNFNPQMSIGAEFRTGSSSAYFLSLRLHHISNGGLDEDNRGINSTLLMIGRFF
jgi:lipid A 3-O-deacylase